LPSGKSGCLTKRSGTGWAASPRAWSGKRFAARSGQAWDVEDDDGIAALKKAGVQLATADAALVSAIREKSKPIEDAWFKEARAKGVDGAKVLAELREETRKMAASRR